MERTKTLAIGLGRSIWTELAVRWALALLFIIPSIEKMLNPLAVARILEGYEVFPVWLVGVLAIMIPFMQLSVGACLLLGIWPWEAGVISLFLLSAFTAVLMFNFLRGHQHDCGCFSLDESGVPLPLWTAIVRNCALLGANFMILRYDGLRKWCLLP